MKRLVFIVEGDCEIAFVEKMLIPYLYANAGRNAAGWFLKVSKIHSVKNKLDGK